jgi:EAL domain-containing protein (putative c-di-GMP-specific phosphodiesterase class I)
MDFIHIVQGDDGVATGAWGPHTLKSAFQPIFAFRGEKLSIVAFEGLIRPFLDGEARSPASFFAGVPALERLQVENLTRTLHFLNAAACLPAAASIFVNFDPSIFTDRAIAESALHDMRQVLAHTHIDPRRVVCEVTEQKSGSQDALFAFTTALKAGGFRVAIDDYGAQSSDMDRIRRLHPDIVKFDARWITRLMESGPGYALLATMVSTFAGQGIETVFEGIEESWQLDLAARSGASMVQGYVLARPEIVPARFLASSQAVDVAGADEQARSGGDHAPVHAARPTVKPFGRRSHT